MQHILISYTLTRKTIPRYSKLNYTGLESERKTELTEAVSSWGPANKTAHIPECMLELCINFQVPII